MNLFAVMFTADPPAPTSDFWWTVIIAVGAVLVRELFARYFPSLKLPAPTPVPVTPVVVPNPTPTPTEPTEALPVWLLIVLQLLPGLLEALLKLWNNQQLSAAEEALVARAETASGRTLRLRPNR
jgi:hypothetical protein